MTLIISSQVNYSNLLILILTEKFYFSRLKINPSMQLVLLDDNKYSSHLKQGEQKL